MTMGLSSLGIVLSAYLTTLHLRHLSTGAPSLCNFSQTLNCDVVNTSAWSELFGTPISHLGTLFYLAMLALSGAALFRPALRPRLHGYLFLGALFSVGYSVFLGAISMTLGALCIFCASLYIVNLLLLVPTGSGGFAALRSLVARIGTDVSDFTRSKAFFVTLIAIVSALAATYQVRLAVATAHAHEKLKTERLPGDQRKLLEGGDAPAIGPADAPITIVEVSDFECPFCQRAAATMGELRTAYAGKLRIVFHHFPLDTACNPLLKHQVHENACGAARAAVCAEKLGQFFPYAEKLFQDGTDAADLMTHAKTLGFAEAPFSACLASPESKDRVQKDIALLSKIGVAAVPVFFVNGRRIAGAQPIEIFAAIIDEELSARR